MRRLYVMPLALVLAALVWQLAAQEKKAIEAKKACPGKDAAVHTAKPYHFSYESWVIKSDKGAGFIFGRCVETKNAESLYVDWKKTHVKGFAEPGWPCQHQLPAPTGDAEPVKTDLWYGAAPAKIEAPYKEVRQTADAKTVPLASRVSMSIPQTPTTKVAKPGELSKIDIEFTCSVETKAVGEKKEYTYNYGWQSKVPVSTARPIVFRWNSAGTRGATGVPPNAEVVLRVLETSQVKQLKALAGPEYTVTVVEFLDQAGEKVVATAPVAIYQPKAK